MFYLNFRAKIVLHCCTRSQYCKIRLFELVWLDNRLFIGQQQCKYKMRLQKLPNDFRIFQCQSIELLALEKLFKLPSINF